MLTVLITYINKSVISKCKTNDYRESSLNTTCCSKFN